MVEKAMIFYKKHLKKRPYGWSGNYASWEEAQEKVSGYDAANIEQKVLEAVLKVKNNEAVYERDSVIFDTIEYSYPLLAALLWIGCKNHGILRVIDFGGSLGSSYFQNKKFLDELKEVHWNIVEQKNFVESGRRFIQDNNLQFHNTLEEALAETKADVLVMSCTLPYIQKPYELIRELICFNIPYILIDNTPFNFEPRNRLTVQKVPPSIYNASYPCWFLDYEAVKSAFMRKYIVVSEHHNDSVIDLEGRKINYQGFLLELKHEPDADH